jgi:hypothetical protein
MNIVGGAGAAHCRCSRYRSDIIVVKGNSKLKGRGGSGSVGHQPAEMAVTIIKVEGGGVGKRW